MVRAALPVLLALLLPAAAAADQVLSGTVIDALTLEPVEGARVVLAATGAEDRTDGEGRYRLMAPAGSAHVLEIAAPGHHALTLVRQTGDRRPEVHLLPTEAPADLALREGEAPLFGVPHSREAARAIPGGEVRLPGPHELQRPDGGEEMPQRGTTLPSTPGDVLRLTQPAQMPAKIRVARYFSSGCSGSYSRIDEVDFEDYVAGVLPAEIGVFKSVPGGPEVSRASFAAFSVLARTYALYFYVTKGPDAAYHINDTACNQRYEDARDAFITEVVQSTAGLVLAKGSDPTVLDKFEYAASCGRNGTRPEYQSTLVPDQPGFLGCTTGGWCGHDNCAAHEDNPDVPGADKCLVRGTCQWGSLEWSMKGEDRDFILAHYEPNLTLVDLGADPRGNLVGVVRAGDVQTGDDLVGATVTLDTGATTVTDDRATFRFDGLPYGTYTLTAEAPGFAPASRTREVTGPGDHWASLALETAPPPTDGGSPEPDAGPDAGAADAGDDGTGDDGGDGRDAHTVSGGCGCAGATGGRSPAGLIALLGVVLLVGRRRR